MRESVIGWLSWMALASVVVISMMTMCGLYTWPPTVHRTWPAGECVRVVPKAAGTCDTLPDRYEVVWVAPR